MRATYCGTDSIPRSAPRRSASKRKGAQRRNQRTAGATHDTRRRRPAVVSVPDAGRAARGSPPTGNLTATCQSGGCVHAPVLRLTVYIVIFWGHVMTIRDVYDAAAGRRRRKPTQPVELTECCTLRLSLGDLRNLSMIRRAAGLTVTDSELLRALIRCAADDVLGGYDDADS